MGRKTGWKKTETKKREKNIESLKDKDWMTN